jgi:Domain of unknown function (DUF4402)
VRRLAAYLAALVVLQGLPASAEGDTASASGSATATVVNSIAVRTLQGLDFGTVTASSVSAGSVVVTPGAGDAQYTGGARRAQVAGYSLPHAARFEVTGEAGRSYTITAATSLAASSDSPNSSATEAASVLRIDSIRLKTASRPGAGPTGQINIFGRDQFDLGGTLRVPAGAAPAHYRANLPVIMAYD